MRLLPVLLSLACLAACGYKGPLYLPQSKAEAAKPQAAVNPAQTAVNPTPAIVHPGPAPDRPVPAEAAPAPK